MNYILQVSLYVLRIPEQVSRFTRGVLRTTYDALRGVDLGLIFAALITLFIIQNFLQPGLPAAADFAIHLYRTMEFEQALAPGVIVPRWAPNLALGYGYPLFVFAPPLPYFLGLVFHLLGLTFESALKVLIILTIPLYAIGMYLLVRDVLDSVEAGLISAVAYAFAPFALREALLYGGNIPQLIAVGLFPWVLWALTGAVCRQSWGWTVASSLFYAGVLLSHLFQALVFTPVVGLYGLVLFLAARKRTPNFRAPHPAESQLSGIPASRPSDHPFALAPYLPLLIIPLGLLLSAFSWLPAFFERFATRAQANIYLEKSPFFVRYPYWPELAAWIEPLDARAANPYVPLSLGLVTLALAGFGLLAGFRLLVGRQLPAVGDRSGVTRRLSSVFLGRLSAVGRPVPSASGSGIQHLPLTHFQIFFFAIVAALAIFMTLPVSRWVWELVSILQVAEFPWRMLGLANLGLAFLAGAAVILLPQKIRPPVTAGCVLLQIVAVAPLLYPVTPFARYGQATIADQIRYEQSSQTIGTTTLGEYLPRTVTRPPTSSPLIEAFLAGQSPQRLDASTLPDGTQATLLEQNGVTHIYQLNTPAAFTLRFFQFDYLGWRAWLDDLPAKIRPESATGLILIDIPAGAHILKIHFGETPLRVVSISLTVLALGLIVLVGRWLNKTGTGLPTRRRRSGRVSQPGHIAPDRSPNPSTSLKRPPGYGGATGLRKMIAVLGPALIIIGAFWLKPLLRPFFTVHSPPHQVLPAQHKTDIRFDQGIRLAGYDLGQSVVAPGDYLPVVLYWETDSAPLRLNLQPFVHLDRLNDSTTVAEATNYTPGDVTTESNMPTFHWDNARYVRDEHDLIVPAGTAPMAYAVRVGLLDPDQDGRLLPLSDGSGDTARLTIVNVAPGRRQPSRLDHRLAISLRNERDTIELTGFQVDSVIPNRLDFRLAWRSERRPQQNYTVFAQLLDSDQNLAASFDRPPLDGAYPTSTWLPGRTIIDRRYIPITGVRPGSYRLIVGLYDTQTGQRLITATGANFVELTTIEIEKR